MTIATELTKLETNLDNAYAALVSKGATISGNKNFDNLSVDIESIPGLDGLGRELRAAYAYTYEENMNGKQTAAIINYDDNKFYETEESDYARGCFLRVILDGKLYTLAVTNEELILTQQGTYDDWVFSYGSSNNGIRGNHLTNTSITDEELVSYSPARSMSTFSDNEYMVYNGKLISTNKLIDDTGIWTTCAYDDNSYVKSIYGNRDGYLTLISEDNLYIYYDIKIKDNLYSGQPYYGTLVIDNNNILKKINFKTDKTFSISTIKTLSKTPKKVLVSDNTGPYVILYNDNTLETYNTSDKLINTYTDVKNIVAVSGFSNYNFIMLKTNGDLYKLYDSSLSSTKLIKNIGANGDVFSYKTTLTRRPSAFTIFYNDDIINSETLYVPSVLENTAYYNVNIQSSTKTITTKTDTSITVGGKTYIRDTSKDSYFTFVPEELANHTFTDQEVCQAALLAGL